MAEENTTPKPARKSATTLLVEIANELYEFGCAAEQRGGISGNPGNDPVAVFAYAKPKGNPEMRRPLEDIRPDIAAMFAANYGTAASPTALGNAMTVLLGKARANPEKTDASSELLAAYGITRIPGDRGLSLVTAQPGCPLPDGYVIPEPYVLEADGIHLVKDDGSGRARVTWGWLFPVCVYVDPAEDQIVELVWRDRNHWVRRMIPRALTKSGRKLIALAGDAGLPVIEADARAVERWLAAAEAANHHAIDRRPVARQLGWQADGKTFVTGQDSPWRVEPAFPRDQGGALRAHHPGGTAAAWREVMESAWGYLVVRAAVSASLAAALLELLGLDSFTADISGASTRGKTVTAMAALSCWADPGSNTEAMLTWRVKSTYPIEIRLNLVNGLAVVIDETRLVRDPAIVDAVLYQVQQNRGVPRGGAYANNIPWRTVVLTTGEQPATSFTTFQGASARVLSILHPPFGPEGEEGREAAESLQRGVEANFGTAGPAFAERLQAALESSEITEIRSRHSELTKELRGDSDMSGRRAPLIAAVALADELAAKWEIVPAGEPLTAGQWLELFAAPDLTDNRGEQALDIVREFVVARSGDLWAPGRDWQPQQGWIGRHYTLEGNATPTVALLPERLREELKRRRHDYDALLPGWREDKVLYESGSGRTPHLHSKWLGPARARMVIFTPGVIGVTPPRANDPRSAALPDDRDGDQ